MKDEFTTSTGPLVRCSGTDQRVLMWMSSRSLGWPLFEVVRTQLSRLMPRTMVVMGDMCTLEEGDAEQVCLLMSRSADAAARRTERVNWDLGLGTLFAVAAPSVDTAPPLGVKDVIVALGEIPHLVPSVYAAIVPDIVWLFSSWRNRMMQADGPNRVSPPSLMSSPHQGSTMKGAGAVLRTLCYGGLADIDLCRWLGAEEVRSPCTGVPLVHALAAALPAWTLTTGPFVNTMKTPALGRDSIFAGVEARKPKEELGTPNIAERVSAS